MPTIEASAPAAGAMPRDRVLIAVDQPAYADLRAAATRASVVVHGEVIARSVFFARSEQSPIDGVAVGAGVISDDEFERGLSRGASAYTVSEIRVTDPLGSGVPAAGVVRVAEMGGTVNGVTWEVVESSLLSAVPMGESVVILLGDLSLDSLHSPLNTTQSVLIVGADGTLQAPPTAGDDFLGSVTTVAQLAKVDPFDG